MVFNRNLNKSGNDCRLIHGTLVRNLKLDEEKQDSEKYQYGQSSIALLKMKGYSFRIEYGL